MWNRAASPRNLSLRAVSDYKASNKDKTRVPLMKPILDAVESIEHVRRRGMLFILSSPSGAGKTTLAKRLMQADPAVTLSVSATTRKPREGEVDGVDYHFVDKDTFAKMVVDGEMLEHATVFDNYYGSPRAPVEKVLTEGRDVLFDVDWQGAQQIRDSMKEDVVSVFILPPSVEALEERLRNRGLDDEATIQHRMDKSIAEMLHWPEYDYVLINADLDTCTTQLGSVLAAERLKLSRRKEGLETMFDRLKGD
jgi:guanylate kinase